MNRGSLVQDILDEVSSRIISFQIRLHLLITLVKSSEYFRFIESLRTCIMASQRVRTLRVPAGRFGALSREASLDDRKVPIGDHFGNKN